MTKYSCIVVDDNLIERDAVTMNLEKISSLSIVAECESAQEAIQAVNQQPVDIVFSDVQMPDMSGFELSKSFRTPPVFIFITSFKEFAVESFDIDAIDFVLKPVTFARLQKATNKAIEYIELKKSAKDRDSRTVELAEHVATKTDEKEYFFIKETDGFTKINYNNVLYVESMGDFSKIHTVQKATHVILVSLKNFENQLTDEVFKRVHKQYIVNLSHIATITSTDIVLSNGEEIPVSNIYRQQLIDKVVNKKLLHRS